MATAAAIPIDDATQFLTIVRSVHGNVDTITRPQIQALVRDHGAPDPQWLWRSTKYKLGNGVYRLPELEMGKLTEIKSPTPAAALVPSESLLDGVENMGGNDLSKIIADAQYAAFVPYEDPLYVPFGNYFDVETITTSGRFFPYWIYGLSGNGKTLSIEQAHARNKKKLIVTPISREADEDSLLGGLRLMNGNTVPFFGPVTIGALLGVTVLLDETDQGDEKMMCLQTPLQNRPYLIKRLGIMIYPKPGFNICATANTKGQGDEDGRFVGANIMNEAQLDRYVVTFEQEYPDTDTERQILQKFMASRNHTTMKDEQFVERLLSWGAKVRQTFKDGATSEVITTRRLVHVCNSYDMFGKDRKKAVRLTLARFNADIKQSFMEFYEAIDENCNVQEAEAKRQSDAIAKGKDPETKF